MDWARSVFTIANSGGHAVRLVGLGSTAGLGEGVRLAVRMSKDRHGGFGPFVPFGTTTLPPGQQRLTVVAVTFPTSCPSGKPPRPDGADTTVTDVPVTYEFLGVRHTVDLAMFQTAYTMERPPFCW